MTGEKAHKYGYGSSYTYKNVPIPYIRAVQVQSDWLHAAWALCHTDHASAPYPAEQCCGAPASQSHGLPGPCRQCCPTTRGRGRKPEDEGGRGGPETPAPAKVVQGAATRLQPTGCKLTPLGL